jgi:hypothetical protein
MPPVSSTPSRSPIACSRRVVGHPDANPSSPDAERLNQVKGQQRTPYPLQPSPRAFFVLGSSILTLGHSRHAKRPRKPRKPPGVAHVRRTQRHPSVRSLRICSSARIGGRGSRQRIPTRALVCRFTFFSTWAEGFRTFCTGEVGKLLGAKWKELDDEEKKVRWTICTFSYTFPWHTCVQRV